MELLDGTQLDVERHLYEMMVSVLGYLILSSSFWKVEWSMLKDPSGSALLWSTLGWWSTGQLGQPMMWGREGFVRFLDSVSPPPFWLPAPHVIPSFINVFDIVSDKSKLDKSLPQRRRHGGRLPSKISAALSSGRLGTCCDHCLFAGWLVSSQHSDRAGGKMWKSRGT